MIAATDTRSANTDHPIRCIKRMTGLETAAGMLGNQEKLADALGIEPRSLRAKLAAERGISGDDLKLAAAALDARADRIREHAAKLRAEA